MKKILLSLVFVASSVLAYAQYSAESGRLDISNSTKYGIIRHWKSGVAVASFFFITPSLHYNSAPSIHVTTYVPLDTWAGTPCINP